MYRWRDVWGGGCILYVGYSIGEIFALILSCWIVLNRSWPECMKADIPG
jgi:hypothetical protein